MKKQFLIFILRWVLNSFGLWIAVWLFDANRTEMDFAASVWIFLLAGLIFSIVNAVLKPIAIILALPAILLTLGLFTIIVNGFMVYVSLLLTPNIELTFWQSVLTGIILSLINYIVSSALELQYERRQGRRI
jgi:putative membrane protein